MQTSLFHSTFRWFLPGLIAGVVFLAIALLAGTFNTTTWAMPEAIAQTVGVSAPVGYGFALGPLLVGVIVHLVLSIGLGIVFTATALWLRLHGWVLVAAAVVFVSIETAVALWVVLHNMLSATTFSYFLSAIPWWGSVLGHYAYALVLGLLLVFGPFALNKKTQRQIA
jgi:hypothetical protein